MKFLSKKLISDTNLKCHCFATSNEIMELSNDEKLLTSQIATTRQEMPPDRTPTTGKAILLGGEG